MLHRGRFAVIILVAAMVLPLIAGAAAASAAYLARLGPASMLAAFGTTASFVFTAVTTMATLVVGLGLVRRRDSRR